MSSLDPSLILHLHRSYCIDAFAGVEAVISAILSDHAAAVSYELLGQKIAALRALPANTKYSKASRSQMHAALDELEVLTPIRNDLVHGELILLTAQGHRYAGFVNARHQGDLSKQARLMTADTFTILAGKLKAITARIEAAAQPPRPPAVKSKIPAATAT